MGDQITSAKDRKNKNEMLKKYYKARIQNQENFYYHPSYVLEQQLLRCISHGELEEAYIVLDEINQLERARLSKDAFRSLKNSLICSCTLFTRAIIKGGADPEKAFDLSDVYIQEIEDIYTQERLAQLEYEMVHTFITTLKSEKNTSYQFVVNKAIHFINLEILHELTLERISEYVKVHPSYLSKIFKDEIGINLTEFINKKKIEESKYFLTHSTSTISEIANLYKFCNQSYYSALFKKYTGITPKQYRNQYTDSFFTD